MLLAGVLIFAAAGLFAHPSGLALVALFYALYRAVLVVGEARLQERIDGRARATVTSVAGVGTDLAGLLLYGSWAVAGLPAPSCWRRSWPWCCRWGSAAPEHAVGRTPSGRRLPPRHERGLPSAAC
ncbi:hypothetical protein ACFSVJ_24390 [Prauserella oleivorans]